VHKKMVLLLHTFLFQCLKVVFIGATLILLAIFQVNHKGFSFVCQLT